MVTLHELDFLSLRVTVLQTADRGTTQMIWRPQGDSNPWPPPWQGGVLTNWTMKPILVLQFILYASLNSFTRDYCLLLRLHNASRRLLCLQTAKLILLRPRFPQSPLCWSCYPVRTLIAICYVVSTLLCCLRHRRRRSRRVYISLTVP
jgi:hypothetical protein